jgi:hypothetical protein
VKGSTAAVSPEIRTGDMCNYIFAKNRCGIAILKTEEYINLKSIFYSILKIT